MRNGSWRKIVCILGMLTLLTTTSYAFADSNYQSNGNVGFTGKWSPPTDEKPRQANNSNQASKAKTSIQTAEPSSSATRTETVNQVINSELPRTGDTDFNLSSSTVGFSILALGAIMYRKSSHN